jgi:hypothetical protein
VRLHRRFEIGVLVAQIGKHVLVVDVRIAVVLEPVPGILDPDAVALEAVGALLGARRRGKFGRAVHRFPLRLAGLRLTLGRRRRGDQEQADDERI